MIVKDEIKGVSYEKLPLIANISHKMEEYIFELHKLGYSINAIRIILILSANLKERQDVFKGKNGRQQLDLFDNEWLDVDNDKSYSVQLKFKFSDFLPKGSKNYLLVRKGIDELQEKNYLLEFYKPMENGKKRKFELKSALISSYLIEERKGFKMTINNFWYKALLDIIPDYDKSSQYNKFIKNIIFDVNYNSLIFYMYLQTLKKIESKDINKYENVIKNIDGLIHEPKGTRMKKETFRDKFKIDYKYDSDLKRKVLDVWRSDLNNNTDLSFGYSIDDSYITIVTYVPKKTLIENNLINLEETKIKAAINYKFKNNNLDTTQAIYLLEIYLKYTYKIVFKATERKSILRGLKGQLYYDTFLELVMSYIKKQQINVEEIRYQNINEMRTNIRKSYNDK